MTKLAHLTTSDISLALLMGHQIRAYQEAGFQVTGISAAGAWSAQMGREGVRHIALPSLRRTWAPLDDARAFAAMVRIFRQHRFDIVHTHNPKTGVLGRIAARLAGVPVVVNTVHGLYGTDGGALRRTLFLGMERLAASCSDFEFCQSGEDLDLLRRLRIIRPDRSMFIGNGVDLSVFDPAAVDRAAIRAQLGVDDQTLVVGAVGRLVREKGYGEFFDAAERVRATNRHVRFIAVGPFDDDKSDAVSPSIVDDLERRGIVRFLGLRDDMPAVYRAMDLFVLPSHREGFPRSAVEAAAMGLPLVLTNIRGCREVVTDGRNGLLVPPRDAGALEAAVRRLIADPGARHAFGEENRRLARAQFDERRIIASTLDTYRRLLVEKRGRVVDGLDPKSHPSR